jgi:RimJ/RimL family protein N-acetyltransferase
MHPSPARLQRIDEPALRALAAGQAPAGWQGAAAATELTPDFVARRALEHRAAGAAPEWCDVFWIVVDGLVVGGCGFKGPPQDGLVEIGYGVAASWRGRGVASAAVGALCQRAFAISAPPPASAVLACIAPDNAASAGVVRKLGFTPGLRFRDPQGELLVAWTLAQPRSAGIGSGPPLPPGSAVPPAGAA